MNAKWTILVVYEGAAAKDPAIKFCDGLVQRFWPDFTCELNWFRWDDLQDGATRKGAERNAAETHFLIVAAGDQKKLPSHVQRWLEQAIKQRGDREGIMVGLTGVGDASSATQLYLRKLAHQGGMDYLTAIPQSLPHTVSDSAESYNVRATQMTSVLGSILSRVHPPPRLS